MRGTTVRACRRRPARPARRQLAGRRSWLRSPTTRRSPRTRTRPALVTGLDDEHAAGADDEASDGARETRRDAVTQHQVAQAGQVARASRPSCGDPRRGGPAPRRRPATMAAVSTKPTRGVAGISSTRTAMAAPTAERAQARDIAVAADGRRTTGVVVGSRIDVDVVARVMVPRHPRSLPMRHGWARRQVAGAEAPPARGPCRVRSAPVCSTGPGRTGSDRRRPYPSGTMTDDPDASPD